MQVCPVGTSVVTALSESLVVRVQRDGAEWEQRFSRGRAVSLLEKLGRRAAAARPSWRYQTLAPATRLLPDPGSSLRSPKGGVRRLHLGARLFYGPRHRLWFRMAAASPRAQAIGLAWYNGVEGWDRRGALAALAALVRLPRSDGVPRSLAAGAAGRERGTTGARRATR